MVPSLSILLLVTGESPEREQSRIRVAMVLGVSAAPCVWSVHGLMAASASARLGKVTAAWELPCHLGWAMAVTPGRTSFFLSIRDILRVTRQSREMGAESKSPSVLVGTIWAQVGGDSLRAIIECL